MNEYASFSVAGGELEVVEVQGHEALCRHFDIAVRCRVSAEESAPQPKALVGTAGVLTLNDGHSSRTLTGVVAQAFTLCNDDGSTSLQCTLKPAAFLLTLGRNCRPFIDKTVIDIVTEVLAGVPHRWEVSDAYPLRAYTVQYREDDWTFISRLLENEGIYWWFDHAAGSMLVLSDSSTAAPDLDGGGTLPFHRETGMLAEREVIEALGEVVQVTPEVFTIRSFNFERPALDVSGSMGGGAREHYDAPGGGPMDPSLAQRQAELLHAAAMATASGVTGKTNCPRLTPGRVVTVTDHLLPSHDGPYFVTGARYTIRQRRRDTDAGVERTASFFFTAIDKAVPFVPPRITPLANQAGIQTGVVGGPAGEEIYPDELGQVRVQQHWDRQGARDDVSGSWMRVAQRGTHDSLQLPRIGWNVLTFNEEGAVDAPSVLARLNDTDHPPAYSLPAHKTRVVYKTDTSPFDGSSNEVFFEDAQGAEEMFINASRDMNVLVQNAKVESVNNDQLRTVGVDHSLLVVDDRSESVRHDQYVDVGADDTLIVGAGHHEQIGGHRTTNVAGSRSLDAGAACSLTVKGAHNTLVGAARIDTCLGEIATGGDIVSLTAGAAQLKLAAQGVAETCGGVSVQTIGGAKLEITKGERLVNVEKTLVETVGGLMMLKTDGHFTDAATKTSSWTTGLKMSTRAKQRTLIRAKDKIQIRCGASTITIEPKNITLQSTKLVLKDADMLKIETGKILHN